MTLTLKQIDDRCEQAAKEMVVKLSLSRLFTV
jgi:hypothetical protein